jgi:hypothetical protein
VAAAASADWDTLRALLRFEGDPDPDVNLYAGRAAHDSVRIALLSASSCYSEDIEAVEHNAEWLVDFLADPRLVRPYELYLCATKCLRNQAVNMARAIAARLRDWGGVRGDDPIPPDARKDAFENLWWVDTGLVRRSRVAEVAPIIYLILSQLKTRLTDDERALVNKFAPAACASDGSV